MLALGLCVCLPACPAAARRVLPGHLLRRCRVLSSVQLGEVCQQRVALTGRRVLLLLPPCAVIAMSMCCDTVQGVL